MSGLGHCNRDESALSIPFHKSRSSIEHVFLLINGHIWKSNSRTRSGTTSMERRRRQWKGQCNSVSIKESMDIIQVSGVTASITGKLACRSRLSTIQSSCSSSTDTSLTLGRFPIHQFLFRDLTAMYANILGTAMGPQMAAAIAPTATSADVTMSLCFRV
jgi:hypothetical protein